MTLETTAAPAASDNSPLTLDQAVEIQVQALKGPPKSRKPAEPAPVAPVEEDAAPVEAEAGEEDQPISEADTQSADDTQSELETANAEGDEAGQEEPETPAIDPPQFWDAEGKERFAKLTPESQKEVLAYEKQRTAVVAKALQESTETKKRYEAKQQQLQGVVEALGKEVNDGSTVMKAWDDWFASPDAIALAKSDPGAHYAERVRYDDEKRAFDKAKADKATAEGKLFEDHWEEVHRLMPTIAPELADPVKGPERNKEVASYLSSLGIPPDRIRWISAHEASIAWKALQYDKAQKVAKTPPKPTPPKPKPAGPTAAPAGQGQRPSSDETRLRQLNAKKNLSLNEATEIVTLEGKLGKKSR